MLCLLGVNRYAGVVDKRPATGSQEWWRQHARDQTRPAPLSVDRIIEASLGIIDSEGLGALTMRRVAAELETGAASLYRHIESRDALLMLVIDLVWGEVLRAAASSESLTPRGSLIRTAHCALEVYREHRNLVPALQLLPVGSPSSLALQEYILSLIDAAGIKGRKAILTLYCLSEWVIGFVLQEFQPDIQREEGGGFPALLSRLDPEIYPLLSAATSSAADISVYDEFDFGLNTVLDGLGF